VHGSTLHAPAAFVGLDHPYDVILPARAVVTKAEFCPTPRTSELLEGTQHPQGSAARGRSANAKAFHATPPA
jgi:hypothetical protein